METRHVSRPAAGNALYAGTRPLTVLSLLHLLFFSAQAATYYVAPDGDNANGGSKDKPFATMARGQTAAKAGDTVYFRGGIYQFKTATAANGVLLDKSGAAGNRIKYWAYPGEIPVFDFIGMTAQARITGLRTTGSYLHLKGLELKNVPQILTTEKESWCIWNSGSDNIFERLNMHNIMGPGLFISNGGNNLALNCDSHDNFDSKSGRGLVGGNADGFGCHIGAGHTGNVFRGCRAWYNTDDGFDLIAAQEAVLIENCWSWYNGYEPGTRNHIGDGKGFKAGGYNVPAIRPPAIAPMHTVRFCLAYSNFASGFHANYHPGPIYWYNNIGYANDSANFRMVGYKDGKFTTVGILKNNISYKGQKLIDYNAGIDESRNSWTLPVTVSDEDFRSVDPTGLDGPRQADGSLPDIPFLKLAPGSDLIDKGLDVKLAFEGSAPDLGPFETKLSVGLRPARGLQPKAQAGGLSDLAIFDLSGRKLASVRHAFSVPR